jgi:hypothetical protein
VLRILEHELKRENTVRLVRRRLLHLGQSA